MDKQVYRPDIDGLRAVAVVLVLLFHADLGLRGGFVGVDVFFVISGFLITRILVDDGRPWRPRLSAFWIRRIRRILPAACLVVAATMVGGFVILLPSDFVELAQSVLAQQLMVSNFYFWKTVGYFGGNAAQKPLLHTWSLAVEEQFYLVYPLLLVWLGRLPRQVFIGALLAGAVVSFGISDWAAGAYPKEAFYLLPTRAWEILLGGLMCLAPLPRCRSGAVANALAGSGIAAILFSAWYFDSTTRFPGRAALVPCAATAIVMYASSSPTTWGARLLGAKPLVFIGLISYSLYLWHWPVLAFLNYLWCGAQPGPLVRAGGLAASGVLAMVSWYCVELPFRRGRLLAETRRLLSATAVAFTVLVAGALAIIWCDGLPERFPRQSLTYASAKNSKAFMRSMGLQEVQQRKLPRFGMPRGVVKCLIWGDSHAMALIAGLDAACTLEGVQGFQATRIAAPPLLKAERANASTDSSAAEQFNRAVVDCVVAERIDVVEMACVWAKYAQNPGFEPSLRMTIEELTAAGTHVVLVRDVARFSGETDPTMLLSLAVQQGRDVSAIGVPGKEYTARNRRCNAMLDRCAGAGVTIIDPAPALVDGNGMWRAEFDGAAMYRDSHHLSVEGSLRVAPLFANFFADYGARRRGDSMGSPPDNRE